MPLAKISVPAHLDAAKVLALADAVHEALVATCAVPRDDRFQLIARYPAEAMLIDPTFGKVQRTADAVIIEITFLAGRTDHQKRALYQAIAKGAVAGGYKADDITVTLVENSPIDWSLGRGLAAADVAMH